MTETSTAAASSSQPKFLVVGNPQNRRIAFFRDAVLQAGFPPPIVLAYVDLLSGRARLGDHLLPGVVLRIESPGEDFEVERLLLRAGAADAEAEGTPFLSGEQIDRLEFDRGLILHPRQWFLGFQRVLSDWTDEIRGQRDVRVMNAPADIATMFNKSACHERLRTAGLPTPKSLGTVSCFEELIMRMVETGMQRVFVKLAHGSSASGVVALQRSRDRMVAVTSTEVVRNGGLRLYNSLKIRRYTKPREIAELIDALCAERVHVEEWLPKASLDGRHNVDLRVVTIGGAARHLVVREGRSPMTNLHLGNRRGDAERLLERLGPSGWESVQATCARAMSLFPESLYSGIDVLLSPGFRRHAVLELNAFGDLLPGIMCNGKDTYSAEIDFVSQRLWRRL